MQSLNDETDLENKYFNINFILIQSSIINIINENDNSFLIITLIVTLTFFKIEILFA